MYCEARARGDASDSGGGLLAPVPLKLLRNETLGARRRWCERNRDGAVSMGARRTHGDARKAGLVPCGPQFAVADLLKGGFRLSAADEDSVNESLGVDETPALPSSS